MIEHPGVTLQNIILSIVGRYFAKFQVSFWVATEGRECPSMASLLTEVWQYLKEWGLYKTISNTTYSMKRAPEILYLMSKVWLIFVQNIRHGG